MRNVLSPFSYHRRHKQQTALLLGIVCAAVIGAYLLGALSLAIFYIPSHASNAFLGSFSTVAPIRSWALDPGIIAQIRTHPDVARIIAMRRGIDIKVPDPVRGDTRYYLLGLQEADIDHVLQKTGLTLGEGRYPEPRASEIILSEKLAAALDLQVGDTIDRSVDPVAYEDIVEPMEVVGIMAGDVRLMIVPYEYLSNHELYHNGMEFGFLVEAQEGRQAAVDDFLINEIQSRQVAVQTLPQLRESIAEDNVEFSAYATPIFIILTLVTATVTGVINQVALAKRLPEFGILLATGHDRKWLTRRLVLETAMPAIAGWALGLALSWIILHFFGAIYFAPRGHDLHPISFLPLVLVIPIPLAVIGFTIVGARRVFARLDAIAIVERKELSIENSQRTPTTSTNRAKTTNLPRALAATTFYGRHRRRAVALICIMAAAIMMVSLLIFNFSITGDAAMTSLNVWKKMSLLIQSEAGPLEPGVISQVKVHPSVERAIPTLWLRPLFMAIPPFSNGTVHMFGVSEDDMAYLIALFDLKLKEGHLPRANTNEMVISEVTAQNRGLKIGDVIGSYDHPVYRGAPVLPVEMVISGIFAKSTTPEDECWLSFASLEFMERHEAYRGWALSLLVTPKEGQNAMLDTWLEQEMAKSKTTTMTYRQQLTRRRENTRSTILTIAVLESAIAFVIALALAVLNHIFVSQRLSEFGVLNALGRHWLQLVWRTTRETAFTAMIAWGAGVALCCIALLGLQISVFTPLGLRFNFFNPAPWLSTLPVPIVVLMVTAVTTGRTLSKLDPVTIIERR